MELMALEGGMIVNRATTTKRTKHPYYICENAIKTMQYLIVHCTRNPLLSIFCVDILSDLVLKRLIALGKVTIGT